MSLSPVSRPSTPDRHPRIPGWLSATPRSPASKSNSLLRQFTNGLLDVAEARYQRLVDGVEHPKGWWLLLCRNTGWEDVGRFHRRVGSPPRIHGPTLPGGL